MVDANLFRIPRPARFVEPESDEQARRQVLREVVWDHIPNRLREHPLREEFKPLVNSFELGLSWVLLGPTGSGKSTACVHLVRELLRRGVENGGSDFELAKGIFWTRADAITAAGADKGDQAWKLLHRAQHSKLMVLDDIAETSKTLLRVIQQRYDAGRALVVTSGALDANDLRDRVGGDAPVRWMLECGQGRRGVILRARTEPLEVAAVRPFPRRAADVAPAQARQRPTSPR
jgi:hypothetical protein